MPNDRMTSSERPPVSRGILGLIEDELEGDQETTQSVVEQDSKESTEASSMPSVESGPDLTGSKAQEPENNDEEETFSGEATLSKLRDGDLVFDPDNPGSGPKNTPDDEEDEEAAFNKAARETYDSAARPREPEPEQPAATSGSFSNEDVEQVIETPPPTPPQPPVAEATPEPEDKGPNSVDDLLLTKNRELLEQDYGRDSYTTGGGNLLAREIVQRAINEGEVRGDIDQMPLPRIRQLAHEVYIAHRDAGFGRRPEEPQPTDVAVVAPEAQPEPAQPEAPVETPAAATPEPAHQAPYEPTDEELMRRFGLNEDELHEARLRWGSEKLKDEVVVIGESRKPVDPGTLEEWLIREERDRITDQINRTTQPNNQPNNAIGFVGGENPDGPADNNPDGDEDEPIDGEIVGDTLEEVIASRPPEFWRDLVGTYEGHGEPRPYTDAERERVKALLEAAGFYREGMYADEAFYAAQEVYFTFLCGDRILGAREYLVQGLLENLGNDQLEQRLNELRGRLEFLHLENMPPEMRARLETWLYLDILDNLQQAEPEPRAEEHREEPDRRPVWERTYDDALLFPEGTRMRQNQLNALFRRVSGNETIPEEFKARLVAEMTRNQELIDGARRGPERRDREMTVDQVRVVYLNELVQLMTTALEPRDFQPQMILNRLIQEGGSRWTNEQRQAFREEGVALGELLRNLRASLYFQETPGAFGRAMGGNEKATATDQAWLRVAAYREDNFYTLLSAAEGEVFTQGHVSEVWQMLVVMGQRAANPAILEAALTPTEAAYRRGIKDNQYMAFTRQLVAEMVADHGVSEYEAWIGIILFDAFHAAEYNKNHYLYSITRPEQFVNNVKVIWWGSRWDYRDAVLNNDVRLAASRADTTGHNIFPAQMWTPPGVQIADLSRDVLSGQGVERLMILTDPNAIRTEKEIGKINAKIRDVNAIMNAVAEIAPGTDVDKMDVAKLWGVRGQLIGIMRNPAAAGPELDKFMDPVEVLGFMEQVIRVYFLELSVYDEGAAGAPGKAPRAQDPYELWKRFAVLADVRNGAGFFNLPGVDPIVAQQYFDRTRVFVLEICRGYLQNPTYSRFAQTVKGRPQEIDYAMSHFPQQPVEYGKTYVGMREKLEPKDALGRVPDAAFGVSQGINDAVANLIPDNRAGNILLSIMGGRRRKK